nr:LytTR family DNA-binding domain-containing protein [uncultured Caproiciproducens sp.]
MLEIALCDDDDDELNILNSMILKYGKEKNINVITFTYTNGEDLLLSTKNFHVIFLDIRMNGLNGIDVGKKVRENDKYVKIIYVTNFTNYQTDAFTVRAFGYVTKPFAYETICKQMDDVIDYTDKENKKISFTFHTDRGIKTLNLEDIYYFESYNHRIKIVSKNEVLRITDSINNILNNLKSFGFSMPHKSFVINLLYVASIKGYDITLTNGSIIPISQKRSVDFKAEVHSFLKSNFNLLIRR